MAEQKRLLLEVMNGFASFLSVSVVVDIALDLSLTQAQRSHEALVDITGGRDVMQPGDVDIQVSSYRSPC